MTRDIQLETQMIAQVPTGALFEHYKGKKYRIIATARHSETLGLCVIYQALYNTPEFGENSVWVRPLDMFLEIININGVQTPRFRRLP